MPRKQKLEALQPLIGRWMTLGSTVAGDEAPLKISASDVYEWAPGRAFVVHAAYGVIGEAGVGGTEIIGYDGKRKLFRTWFFDSDGKVEEQTLRVRRGVWVWEGARTRCTGRLSPDGKILSCKHEQADGAGRWAPSMDVTLYKVE